MRMPFPQRATARARTLKLAITTTALCSGLAAPLGAQTASVQPPPVRQSVDEHGVDVLRKTFNMSATDVSIGPKGKGLSYTRVNTGTGWSSDAVATIVSVGSTYIVTVGGQSDSFTSSGLTGPYTPTEANGASLIKIGSIYTYTARDGTRVHFTSNSGYYYSVYNANVARVQSIETPDGTVTYFYYKIQTYCPGGYEYGGGSAKTGASDQSATEGEASADGLTIPDPAAQLVCQSPTYYAVRLQGMDNSNGYALKFTYASNATTLDGVNYDDWNRITAVKAINSAVEYCDMDADSCTLSGSWPTATYSYSVSGTGDETTLVTDPAGRTTRYWKGAGYGDLRVRRPSSSTDNLIVTGGTVDVATVTNDGVTYSYSYVDSGTTRTTTVTDPNGNHRIYVGDTGTNLLSSFQDELGNTTSYSYDANGRVTEIVAPEGNKTQYAYDTRGNVTQTTFVAKAGSGLANITTSASYPPTCTSAITCNKPTSTTDAGGNVTDYTYDATHGGALTITAPAPSSGAARPQTRLGYTAYEAYYKDGSGSIVASGYPTYQLTSTSACMTGSSCTGTASEVKSTIGYGPQSAGTANNLSPVSVTKGSGDGALAATTTAYYDAIGNVTAVDGPLPGSSDTSRAIYNADRQVVGTIGPDPDGSGALIPRARKITYDADGDVSWVEIGTVPSGATDLGSFATLQSQYTGYDAAKRKISSQLIAGGTTQSYVQYSYDALGRLDCATTRMNPATFSSLPGACTLGSEGSFGPDRIIRNSYDAASRPTQTISAYGMTYQRVLAAATYSANGKQATLTDGESHVTTYEYDGFDRLSKTRFPNTSGGGSSSSDYEQLSYDSRGNVTQRRLRDGKLIGFGYDALGRVVSKDLPNTASYEYDIGYAYDNLGHLTSATNSNGHYVNFGWDALGRNTGEANNYYSFTNHYDLAGRRTAIVHGDGLTINYEYLVTGEVSAIRENNATVGTGVLASYFYDNLGRRVSLYRGNGAATFYGFDAASRLTGLQQDLGGTSYDLTLGFSYNPASQIVTNTRSSDAYAWGGAYDVNRAYAHNGLNQMTAAGGVSMGYDGRGNLTSVGTDTYSFTAENQLDTAVIHGPGGAVSSTNAYDPLGRMHWYRQNLVFTYDGGNILAELGAGNAIQRRYVYGPGEDEPVVWYEGAGTSQKYWLHADERGSVNAVTDGSGNVVGTNTYDEYGVPGAGNMGRFQYTGQAWLSEIGLYYYKARMYSPTLGRFMQPDPVGYGPGTNLHVYVNGDPVNLNDPYGLEESPCKTAQYCGKNDQPIPNEPDIIVTGPLIPAISILQVRSIAGPVGLPPIGVRGIGSTNATEDDNQNDCPPVIPAAHLPQKAIDRGWTGETIGENPTANFRSNKVNTELLGDDKTAMTVFVLLSMKAGDWFRTPSLTPWGAPSMVGFPSGIIFRGSSNDDRARVEIPKNTFNNLNVKEIIHFNRPQQCKPKSGI